MADPQFNDIKELHEKLREILVKGALYRSFIYRQQNCHQNGSSYRGQRLSSLPGQLQIFCDRDECKKETWWELEYTRVEFGSNFIEHKTYRCKNCAKADGKSNNIHYLFIWKESEDGNGGLFMKVGQYPPLSIEPSPELAKALGKEDAALYKKALIDANFNHGIGAVAYFRRVLENKINLLLDLIAEAARIEQTGEELLKELETVKVSRALEKRIQYASQLLPAHLRPGGHNPLDQLYGVASAGLHGESDEECLNIFTEAKFVFEYLFKNLTASNEEAREYVRRLSAPVTAKGNQVS